MSQIDDSQIRKESNGYLGMIKVSPDIWYLIGALAQLERDLIVERVKLGLHNAKMKGKLIGRKKTRNSELIRTLLAKKLPLRLVASLAGCSHGSVSLEKSLVKKEEAEKQLKMAEEEHKLKEQEIENQKSALLFQGLQPAT